MQLVEQILKTYFLLLFTKYRELVKLRTFIWVTTKTFTSYKKISKFHDVYNKAKKKNQIKSKKTYGIKREQFNEVFYIKTCGKKTSESRKAAVEHSLKTNSWVGQKLLMFQGLN